MKKDRLDKLNRLISGHPQLSKAVNVSLEEGLPYDKLIENVISLDYDTAKEWFAIVLPELESDDMLDFISSISTDRSVSTHPSISIITEFLLSKLDEQGKLVGKKNLQDYYKNLISNLVVILYYQKDFNNIDYCYNLFIGLNDENVNSEAMTVYLYEGLVLSSKKYYYDAIRFYYKALNCAEQLGVNSYKGRIYDCLGRAFGDKGLFKEAYQYYNLSIANKESMNDVQGLAMTLGNKGRLHVNAGEYEKALDCFRQDLEISEQTNDIIGQVIMTSQIGEVLLRQHKVEEALRFYKKSLDLSEKHSNAYGIGFALIGLSNCYLDMSGYDKLEETLNKIYNKYMDRKGFEIIQAQYYRIRGKYSEKISNLGDAEEEYLKSLNCLPENVSGNETGLIYERLAIVNQMKQDMDKFKSYIIKAVKRFEEANSFAHLKRVLNLLKDTDVKEWLLYKFEGFLGRNVTQYIIQSDTVEHTVKKVYSTVLFSDIRDFTTFSEKISPEDLIETLNDYLSVMTNVILKYGGEIDKYIGDAIMAVYNSESKAETARNSLQSAWQMIKELYLFNKTLIDKKKAPVRIGIGIHSGDVIAGTMGSSYRKNYTVIGDVVNTSSRIEGLTKKYGLSILLSEDTYALCSDWEDMHFREIDKVLMKGKKKPVVVYELFQIGEINPTQRDALVLYRESLDAYKRKAFDKALKGFESLYRQSKEDDHSLKLYSIYAERCRDFIDNPPPGDWNGVAVMKEK
jgi:class 3 adenylate cyclase